MQSLPVPDRIVHSARIRLADNEWGSPLMYRVAAEFFAALPQMDHPVVLHVTEHAGWWLDYTTLDGNLVVVGSANDGAVYRGKVAEFRQWAYYAKWERMGSIDRNDLKKAAPETAQEVICVTA